MAHPELYHATSLATRRLTLHPTKIRHRRLDSAAFQPHGSGVTTPLFDPLAQRLWKLAETAPTALREVYVVRTKDAPRFDSAGRGPSRVHRHAVPTTVVCLAGVVRVLTARGPHDLRPGAMAVFAPAAWHAQAPLRSDAAMYTQGLIFGKSDIIYYTADRAIYTLIPAQPSERMLHAIIAADDPERQLKLGSDLLKLVATTAANEVHVPQAIWKMGQRLWHNLDQSPRAEQILAAAGLSQRQALRIFRAWFGTGPKRVLREQQLLLAAALLRDGVSVDTVIAETGFPDRRSFNRAWRLAHGTPPKR
ncbi:MAG: helix-turn-helix domain-containing protein [Planctomycetota bacterium]